MSSSWLCPVIRVRGGGTGHVSIAGLACYRPGYRCRLIYRLHRYRGRKGETRAFTWIEYRDLLLAAHRQLVQVIRHGLKKIQYQPRLIEGCLAGTGLALDQIEPDL